MKIWPPGSNPENRFKEYRNPKYQNSYPLQITAPMLKKDSGDGGHGGNLRVLGHTFYQKPIQVNFDSYDNFTNLYKSELGQHPTETWQKGTEETRKPSTISLCEAPREICLLQAEPFGTVNFLPGPCWDLRTVGENQLFQQRWMAQRFKQIWGSICRFCSFRFCVEAPAVFCQNQSVESTLGLRQVQVYNPHKNQSRSTPTSKIWTRTISNRNGLESWTHPGQPQLHKSDNAPTTTSQISPLLNSNSFRIQKTLNHFSLRGTVWNLPSSSLATWHHAVFSTLLPGSNDRIEDPRRPSCSIAKSWRNPKHHVLCHVLQKRCGSNDRRRRLEGVGDTSSRQGIGKWPEWGCPCRP